MEVMLICRLVLGEVWWWRREWIGWFARSEAEVESSLLAPPFMVRWYCGVGAANLGVDMAQRNMYVLKIADSSCRTEVTFINEVHALQSHTA